MECNSAVFGPVLFLIHINDLPKCVSCRIRMHADDTKCFSRINCLADVDASQQYFDKLKSWYCDWQLCFNALRCKVMQIGRKNIERTYKLASSEGILYMAEVEDECDLVVNFQSNLQFGNHVPTMCGKANRTVVIIKHTFSRINIDMFRILFKSSVRHILGYSSSAWSPYTKVSVRKIEKIQRLAKKIVENLKDVSHSERLCVIGIPTLQFRRLRADTIQAYKIFNGYEDIDTKWFFTVDSDSYTRGHPFRLKKIRGITVRHI